jgi:hypothetical protein
MRLIPYANKTGNINGIFLYKYEICKYGQENDTTVLVLAIFSQEFSCSCFFADTMYGLLLWYMAVGTGFSILFSSLVED